MNSSPDTKVRKRVRWSWLQTRAFLWGTEGTMGVLGWFPAQLSLANKPAVLKCGM